MTVNRALEDSLMDAPVKVDVLLGEARVPVEELMALSENEIVSFHHATVKPYCKSFCSLLIEFCYCTVNKGNKR